MDSAKVINVLEATANPASKQEAEAQLDQMCKTAGFTPVLLQLVMSDEVAIPVRQSGAIYLEHTCTQHWRDHSETDRTPTADVFSIDKNDRVKIKENIVEAIVDTPEIIRSALIILVDNIIKWDYPEKWPALVDKISIHLQSDNHKVWMGALMILFVLVKSQCFKPREERKPLVNAMKLFLPVLFRLLNRFIDDDSAAPPLLQKQILKIMFTFVNMSLPVELFTEETMDECMKLLRTIIERPIPLDISQINKLERSKLPWCKCKKWALRFLNKMFERYGSPGSVIKEYAEFSKFFLKRYAVDTVNVALKVLDLHRKKEFVCPRVLWECVHALEVAVSHTLTWNIIKNLYADLLKDVLLPLMCFTEEDQKLWDDDPKHYVKLKFDIFHHVLSPSNAVEGFVLSACSKRKPVLQTTMEFCYGILTQGSSTDPEVSKNKDGALNIIGSLFDVLFSRKMYKDKLELMLMTHVMPELGSEYGFMRARACSMMERFSNAKFKKKKNISAIAERLKNILLSDTQLPVRISSAIALRSFLSSQETAQKYCFPHVQSIIQVLLQLIDDTENDDLTLVVQEMVNINSEQVIPHAVDIIKSLTTTFLKVLDSTSQDHLEGGRDASDEADNKAITAMSLLDTVGTILDIMGEEKEITIQVQGIIAPLMVRVLNSKCIDYFESFFALMCSLTSHVISPPIWETLPLIAEFFENDGFILFMEMVPFLHNFCTIEAPQTLISNAKYLDIIFKMCKNVLENDKDEDPACHAAKLLEVILLQCRGHVDQFIPPFVEVIIARLAKQPDKSDVRTMCLQVVVAALFCNPTLLIQTLDSMTFPNTTETISEQFFRQWISDVDCFLGIHDRKMCVLGLCTLLNLDERPACIAELTPQIVPSLVNLFQGLIQAYKAEGRESFQSSEHSNNSTPSDDEDGGSCEMSDSSGSDDEDGEFEDEELVTDEDENDEKSEENEMLENEEFEGLDTDGRSILEEYATAIDEEAEDPVDEFITFKNAFFSLEARDPTWYAALLANISDPNRVALKDIYKLADQRLGSAESKKMEKSEE